MDLNELKGIYPALTTPYENGKISIDRFKHNIQKFNEYGLAGYLVLGSTGESVLLSDKEGLSLVEAAAGFASPGKKIIAGTGRESLDATIDFTNKAAAAGADVALIVTPHYYKGQMKTDVLINYYSMAADKAEIPVLLYNVPKFTGYSLPVEAVTGLAGHPNIAGIKESSGNLGYFEEICSATGDDFLLFQGAGSNVFASQLAGGAGGILAVANIVPEQLIDMADAIGNNDLDTARALQFRILEVNQKIVNSYGIPGIKYAIELLGFFGGEPRLPLLPPDEKVRGEIREILKRAELITG